MSKESSKIRKIAGELKNQFDLKEEILDLNKVCSKHDFQLLVTKLVKGMIETDFERFLTAMYRLDISEEKLKEALNTANAEDVSLKIAQLIISREEEKLYWKEKYKP